MLPTLEAGRQTSVSAIITAPVVTFWSFPEAWRPFLMRIRRSFPIFLAVVLVGAAVAVMVALRKHAPPEAARLLPGADGFLYINLQSIRRANMRAELPPISHEPEYEEFIQATGFQFERDLDEAAFAIHNMVPPEGAKIGPPIRFSEVLVGKIQGERLRDYLKKISKSIEDYDSINIYNIPLEGRVLRVAVIGVDTVAASNHDDPEVLRGIIDRSRKLASPFGGPALLRKYYKFVPFSDRYVPYAGLAWTIFKVEPASGSGPPPTGGLSLLFTKPAVMVASVRALNGVRVRTEAFAASEQDAKQAAEKTNTFLNVLHSAESVSGEHGSDPDVKSFFDSLTVEQSGDRVLVTATAPISFIRKALTSPPGGLSSSVPAVKPDTKAEKPPSK